MCLLKFKGSTGFIVVCAEIKRSCRDHLRFITKLHLQDMPIYEVGSCIFHEITAEWKGWNIEGLFFVRGLCYLPRLYSWLCLIMGRTIITPCEFLSCSSGYCLIYTQPQNITTFMSVHFKYNHLQLGHRNTEMCSSSVSKFNTHKCLLQSKCILFSLCAVLTATAGKWGSELVHYWQEKDSPCL